MAKTIIVLYCDTLSRRNAHRRMPQTMEFFENYHNVPESTNFKKEAYEFYRFYILIEIFKFSKFLIQIS
jgi:hypothetical protein